MISSEVQRTLVKSPPELWAELSDPDALARHLGELGEIRITRVEPDRKIEWEAEGTTGVVQIKASGWGTKVTLSVNRELTPPVEETPAAGESPAVEEPPAAEETPTVEETPALETPPALENAPSAEAPWAVEAPETDEPFAEEPLEEEPLAAEAPAPQTTASLYEGHSRRETPEPEPQPARKRGFFARLFGRREQAQTPQEASTKPPSEGYPAGVPDQMGPSETPEPAALSSPAPALEALRLQLLERQAAHVAAQPGPETVAGAAGSRKPVAAIAEQESAAADPAGEAADSAGEAADSASEAEPEGLSEELRAAEEVAEEEVTAVLVAVLDRLGAAHHRPFSRS